MLQNNPGIVNLITIQHGSHLYGTNTPLSDLDYKSVHVSVGSRDGTV